MPTEFHRLMADFLHEVRAGKLEVYNEFSLQHGLSVFLRRTHPAKKVQLNETLGYFFSGVRSLTKRV
jgi:hypothetical protein